MRSPLKNSNPQFDLRNVRRCGARNRRGLPCRAPAMRGRTRCRLHGGKSTGPRTAEGLKRSRKARWKHGRYSARAIAKRRRERQKHKEIDAILNPILRSKRMLLEADLGMLERLMKRMSVRQLCRIEARLGGDEGLWE